MEGTDIFVNKLCVIDRIIAAVFRGPFQRADGIRAADVMRRLFPRSSRAKQVVVLVIEKWAPVQRDDWSSPRRTSVPSAPGRGLQIQFEISG
jgi:hypothetical protein